MIAECLILIFIIVACITLLLIFSRRNRSMETVVPLKGGAVTDEQVSAYYTIVCAEADPIRTSNDLPGNVVDELNKTAGNIEDCCVLIEKVCAIQIPEGSDDFRPIALIPLFRKLNGDWIADFVKINGFVAGMAVITQNILSSMRSSKYFDAVAPHVLKMDTICRLYVANSPESVVEAIDDQDILYRLSVFYDIIQNHRLFDRWVDGYIYNVIRILRNRCFRATSMFPNEASIVVDALSTGVPNPSSRAIVQERFDRVYRDLTGLFDAIIAEHSDDSGRSILHKLLIASDALDVLNPSPKTFEDSVRRELYIGNAPDVVCVAYGSAINALLNTELGISAIISCIRKMAPIYKQQDIIRGITFALFNRRRRGDVLYHTMRIMKYLTGTESDSILTITDAVLPVCRGKLMIDETTFDETGFAKLLALLNVSRTMYIDRESMFDDVNNFFEEEYEYTGWDGGPRTARHTLSDLLEKHFINERDFTTECKNHGLTIEDVTALVRVMKIGSANGIEMDQFVGYIADTTATVDNWRQMSFTFMLRLIFKIAINPSYSRLRGIMNDAYNLAYKLANRIVHNRDIRGRDLFDYHSLRDSFTDGPSPCGFSESGLDKHAAFDFTRRIQATYRAIKGAGEDLIRQGDIDAAIFQSLIDSYELKADLLLSGIYTDGDGVYTFMTALSSVLDYHLTILHLNGDSDTRSTVIAEVKRIIDQPLCDMLLTNGNHENSLYDIGDRLKNIYLLGLDPADTVKTVSHYAAEDDADWAFSEHLRQKYAARRAEELKRNKGLEYKGTLYDQ